MVRRYDDGRGWRLPHGRGGEWRGKEGKRQADEREAVGILHNTAFADDKEVVAKTLKPTGTILISTPNPKVTQAANCYSTA